jgi:predicted GH43/DUF377 family glycosyl hydrolase
MKFNWKKKGQIYQAPRDNSWRDNSALTPTALLLNDDVIRVYAGMRDPEGISRIGYIDVNAHNPSEIIKVSDKPVLDLGLDGMFDDNGLILGDVLRVGDKIYMYYVGFQLCSKVKFLAYTGLAISSDNGDSFERVKNTPVLDREDEALYIRALHSIIYEDGMFKAWYATGSGWENIDGKLFPQYDINYCESKDGINFPLSGLKCVENNKENLEYRIGRPRVYKLDNKYILNYTYGTTDGKYLPGQAISDDGKNWTRNDNDFNISTSDYGWDSKHLCYPNILKVGYKTYMFYNGKDMGVEGFGYAEL